MIQITFLTLFLGLTSGPQAVELAVSGEAPVAALELLLDGAPAGRLTGPPWQGQIDFGPGLLPHELVARALDAEGRELGRARQWVNLPRAAAEVEVALENGPGGRPRAARIAWLTLTAGPATGVAATLDGQPLPLPPGADLGSRRLTVPLPEADPATAHVLSVEVTFAKGSARRDLVFGGGGGEVATELTAVPVRLRRGRLPPLERLQGTLVAGGRPLRVVAIDQEPARLTVVRDVAARRPLGRVGSVGTRIPQVADGTSTIDPAEERFEHALARDARMNVLWPTAHRRGDSGVQADLFEGSRDLTLADGGLLWVLLQVAHPDESREGQRLADAAAVAGLHLLAGNGPRTVLLVLDPQTADASRFTPQQVRRYLAALRVPLVVWSVGRDRDALERAWGEAPYVASSGNFRAAAGRLRRELEEQRVLWVEGLHLPQSIAAAPGAPFELAGE